jgi:hypothetical protein
MDRVGQVKISRPTHAGDLGDIIPVKDRHLAEACKGHHQEDKDIKPLQKLGVRIIPW